MNVIIACDGVFSGKGGMEKLAIDLAETLHLSLNILLVYSGEKVSTAYKLSSSIKTVKINLFDIRECVNKLKHFEADIYVYYYTNQKLLVHTKIAKELSAKLIVTESASPMRITYTNWRSDNKQLPLKSAIERYTALYNSDSIRVEVEESLKYFPKFLEEKLTFFPNGCNYTKNIKNKQKHFNNKILIVGVSKQHKRFDVLLKAFNQLVNEKNLNLELNVAGVFNDTEYQRMCMEYIKEHNLSGKIIFLGAIEDMKSIYEECALHIICSADESFGLVTIESMCFGIPTIGCKKSIGTRNLVKGYYNGLLYDNPEDYEYLSRLILEIYNDDKLYNKLSVNCLTEAGKYDNDVYYYNWKNLIKKIYKQDRKIVNSTLLDIILKGV